MEFTNVVLLAERWRGEIFAGWWIALFGVVVASLAPDVPMPDVPGADKVTHFLVYTGLAAVPVSLDFRVRGSVLGVLLVLLAVGIAIEFAQEAFVVGRDGSAADALADVGGVATGALIGRRIRSVIRQSLH